MLHKAKFMSTLSNVDKFHVQFTNKLIQFSFSGINERSRNLYISFKTDIPDFKLYGPVFADSMHAEVERVKKW